VCKGIIQYADYRQTHGAFPASHCPRVPPQDAQLRRGSPCILQRVLRVGCVGPRDGCKGRSTADRAPHCIQKTVVKW
jgi:hypothetical protein